MKSHYSQTTGSEEESDYNVLLPYEITLLSNKHYGDMGTDMVLLPYEITLLSNQPSGIFGLFSVLLPYEITLLSN